jgi:hypothetical protein
MDLYIHSPIGLHGVVLNSLSTGTNLPLLPYLYSATNQFLVRDKALNLKTKDMKMCCLVSNGGMVVRKGKLRELRRKPAPVLLRQPQISHDVTLD